MGCDIHGFAEVRPDDKSNWWREDLMPDGRNYLLFSVLAGVRGGLYPDVIHSPRGIPEDLSKPWWWYSFFVDTDTYDKEQDIEAWLGDHSYSWLSLDEILSWKGWDTRNWYSSEDKKTSLRKELKYFLTWCKYLKQRHREYEVRLVFGFDS